MKIFLTFIVLALAASASVAQGLFPSSIDKVAQSLSSATSSSAPLPDSKARKGSKRVGGYTSKGKGSHYVGGRR